MDFNVFLSYLLYVIRIVLISRLAISEREKPRIFPASAINSSASLRLWVNSNFRNSRCDKAFLTNEKKLTLLNLRDYLFKTLFIFLFSLNFFVDCFVLLNFIFSNKVLFFLYRVAVIA